MNAAIFEIKTKTIENGPAVRVFISGRTETEVSLKRYKYVGKERDEEPRSARRTQLKSIMNVRQTGLYYYGARYGVYPDEERIGTGWIARFVSVDPLQHKYPHYTPYQYAGNKPVSYIDLDGLEEAYPDESKIELPEFQDLEMKQDNATIIKPQIEYDFNIKNEVSLDIEIGQANLTPLTGGELSLMSIETGYQNTIWRKNWIAIPSYSNSGGLSLGLCQTWGELNFVHLDPWADIPSLISNATIEELGTSVGGVVNYTRLKGKGYLNGKEIFNYKTYGLGVGRGVPVTYSHSLKTIDYKHGWDPRPIDSIIIALNNPSHKISQEIINSKNLLQKSKIDSLNRSNLDFYYHINKDSVNKVLGYDQKYIEDFFNN